MDAARLDALSRTVARAGSRRRALAVLLSALVAVRGPRTTAAGRPCASNFDCPGLQVCGFNDATQRTECAPTPACRGHETRVCKGEFEYTCCTPGLHCCTFAGEEDGLETILASCCPKGYTCDPTAGCVPAA